MHEMGIAMQIIEIATAAIPEGLPKGCVERVTVKVGKLSAVVPDSLKFCFDIVSKDTPIDGAQLVIEEIPVRARCCGCLKEWTLHGSVFSCPACNSGDIKLISGQELNIESIEVAD